MRHLPVILLVVFISCDEVINPTLNSFDAPIVIDAWIYNTADDQTISIFRANPYFSSGPYNGISGALVQVNDLTDPNISYSFVETSFGKYQWQSLDKNDTFGIMNHEYQLEVILGSNTYTAFSTINRVPKIDSITWRLEPANAFVDASYYGEFWSRDPIGSGDTYWIKTWKNGQLLNKPQELAIAYDAGFSQGGNADGLLFIQPIRDAMNPIEFDTNDKFLPPYILGDSAYVEINSITQNAFFFLQQVQIQTNRPGGFSELFATPLANIQSNIVSSNPKEKVLGFFCTSAVSGRGRKFTEGAIFED